MDQPKVSPKIKDKAKESHLLRMAEPTHRDVPQGASTGQSIRGYPKSCIQQVKEVCLFYVSKCSGKYEDNVTAARYVHQMAEEVIALLAGVAGEIKRNKSEPELFQKLLDEWNENFPSSLGALGSPKAIAALISKQAIELNDLRSAVENERNRRDKDVSEILRSMDAQLQAYRNGVMSERRHQQLMEQQQQEAYTAAAEEVKRVSEERFSLLNSRHNQELQTLRESCEKQTARLQLRLQQYSDKLQENHNHYVSRMEKVKASKQKKFDKLLAKYRVAQDKYYQLASTVQDDPSCLSNPSIDDTTMLSRMDYEMPEENDHDSDDDDLEVDHMPPSPDVSTPSPSKSSSTDLAAINTSEQLLQQAVPVKPRSPNAKVTSFDSSADKPARTKGTDRQTTAAAAPSQISPLVNKKALFDAQLAADMRVKYLTEQLENQKNVNAGDKRVIDQLTEEILTLRREIDTYLLRLKEGESLSETYRQTLSLRLGLKPYEVPPFAHCTINTKSSRSSRPLCHTPHFLGPDDKAGCRSNNNVISAYNTVGVF